MKIATLLAVRTVSKRLPHKVMRQIAGKTVFEHTVERLQRAKRPSEVIVCTSDSPVDDIVAEMAESRGWPCFRGSTDDVLCRFYMAAKEYGVDLVVRAQGDNMFVCPEHIDLMLDKHIEAGADWSVVDGLPWGMKSETISFSAIERAYIHAEDTSMSEYMTWYFDQPQYFKILRIEAEKQYHRPNYRVTMDTPEDLTLVRGLCERFDKSPAEITTAEIIELLDSCPELAAINSRVPDRSRDKVIRARVNTRILDVPRTTNIRVMDASDIRMSSGANMARMENLGLELLPAVQINDDKWIGDEQPAFIVAEIGQNHNGSLDIAKQLVDVAAMHQVDAIKSCKRDLHCELTHDAWDRPYEGPQSFGDTYGKHREALELSPEQHMELFEYCKAKGLEYFVSACDLPSVDVMEHIGVNFYKVASRDLTNLPLLNHMAKTGKPIILATGMASEADIADAMITVRKYHNKIVVMQCTSEYPTPYEDCNILAMNTLRRKFNVLTGLSDHTIGIMTTPVAVALGACMIEKHLTLARYMKGTDHACSLEPDGLKRVVRDIRNVERALGNGVIHMIDGAKSAQAKLARSIVSKTAIPEGTTLTEEMLCMKSPGTGLKWREGDLIIGKRAFRDIPADVTLRLEDFE